MIDEFKKNFQLFNKETITSILSDIFSEIQYKKTSIIIFPIKFSQMFKVLRHRSDLIKGFIFKKNNCTEKCMVVT